MLQTTMISNCQSTKPSISHTYTESNHPFFISHHNIANTTCHVQVNTASAAVVAHTDRDTIEQIQALQAATVGEQLPLLPLQAVHQQQHRITTQV